jgi:hypothetical protein
MIIARYNINFDEKSISLTNIAFFTVFNIAPPLLSTHPSRIEA